MDPEQQAATTGGESSGNELAGGTSMADALSEVESSLVSEGLGDEGGEEANPAGAEGSEDGQAPRGRDSEGDKPAVEGKGEGGSPPANPDPNDKAPDTWRKDAKDAWATVPPTVKAEIAKREGDIAKFVQSQQPRIAVAEAMEQKLGPYAQMYQKNGMNIWDVLPNITQAYAIMQWGNPQQKLEMLHAAAKDMGIDIARLQAGDTQGAINPEIDALKAEIRELRSGVRSVTSDATAREHAKLVGEVEAFAKDPKNTYFEEVAVEMQNLLQARVCKSLGEAYEKAVWSNPVTRAKLVEAEAAARQKALAQKATDKTTKAEKAAAVNLKGRTSSSRAAGKDETIEDTMKATLAEIKSRA